MLPALELVKWCDSCIYLYHTNSGTYFMCSAGLQRAALGCLCLEAAAGRLLAGWFWLHQVQPQPATSAPAEHGDYVVIYIMINYTLHNLSWLYITYISTNNNPIHIYDQSQTNTRLLETTKSVLVHFKQQLHVDLKARKLDGSSAFRSHQTLSRK